MASGFQRGEKSDYGRMPFMDHVRELRQRLIKAMLAVIIGLVVGFLIHNWVIGKIENPICHISGIRGLGIRTPQCPNGVLTIEGALSPVTLTFEVSLVVGIIVASPFWSYQLWAFLAPALYKNEKRYAYGFVGTGVPLFLCGVGLCYWIFPTIMRVLLVTFTPGGISNNLPFQSYLAFFLRMVMVFGLSFELPLLVIALNLLGVVSAKRLWSWWRMVVFMIFVFAAAAVPTGEPIGMTALAAPLSGLYFGAVGIATLNDRRRARRAAADPLNNLSPDEASDINLVQAPPEEHIPDAGDFDDVS
jgi:sec-independent protein translocase protein TatC